MKTPKIVALTRISSRNQADRSPSAQGKILRGEIFRRGGTIIDVITAPRRRK